MNYFAHGIRFIDNPWFLAGTAVPDWLSVADRRVRMRERNVRPIADGPAGPAADVAAGVLQHLHDDDLFHSSRAFYEVSTELAVQFRDLPELNDGFRPGFLGHIVTEMVIDRVLIEQNPGKLDEYYAALGDAEPTTIQDAVNRMAPKSTDRLANLVQMFCEIRFLYDYVDSGRLLHRLNQVMRRVKLGPLPDESTRVLEFAHALVSRRLADLLPEGMLGGDSSESASSRANEHN